MNDDPLETAIRLRRLARRAHDAWTKHPTAEHRAALVAAIREADAAYACLGADAAARYRRWALATCGASRVVLGLPRLEIL